MAGTYFNPWAQPAYQGVPAARASKLAKLVDCDSSKGWPKALRCLRRKSAANITDTIFKLFVSTFSF